MLSKRASTRYSSFARSAPRLPTFSASTRSATKPAVTKAPNQRSMDVLSIFFVLLVGPQHESREHQAQGKDREGGSHHGSGRRSRHAFGGRRRIVALERRDHGDRDAEHESLHEAVQ